MTKTRDILLAALIIGLVGAGTAISGGGELNFLQKIWSNVNTNVDTTVSSRASALAWTTTRAVKVDNLDAAISSRAAAATALSTATWTPTRAGYLDDAISSRASALAWTTTRAARIDSIPTSPIKSIQRGTATINDGSSGTTAAITAVTLAKSILIMNNRGSSALAYDGLVAGTFSSTTQLSFVRIGSGGQVEIYWQVVEFN